MLYELGFKLFRKRKDGSYGPLFINRRQKLHVGVVYDAENHPTKGYAVRPGWHICSEANAPHLSKKDRVWCIVGFHDYTKHIRPESQGGLWFTANKMVILGELDVKPESISGELALCNGKEP
jgi:hypothetical protein